MPRPNIGMRSSMQVVLDECTSVSLERMDVHGHEGVD
jgi:hypothetical protein